MSSQLQEMFKSYAITLRRVFITQQKISTPLSAKRYLCEICAFLNSLCYLDSFWFCVFACVQCVCVCVCVCVCARAQCMCVCMCVCMCACMHACMCVCVCFYCILYFWCSSTNSLIWNSIIKYLPQIEARYGRFLKIYLNIYWVLKIVTQFEKKRKKLQKKKKVISNKKIDTYDRWKLEMTTFHPMYLVYFCIGNSN